MCLREKLKFIFLSSANVFDAYSKYPSYEHDKTLSHSIYGHFKIKIENMLLRLPKKSSSNFKNAYGFWIKFSANSKNSSSI